MPGSLGISSEPAEAGLGGIIGYRPDGFSLARLVTMGVRPGRLGRASLRSTFDMTKALHILVTTFKREVAVYRRVLGDRRTPWPARILLGLAVAYALSPIDIIPDFIPVLGQLDDIVIVPMLVWVALRFVPRALVDEHRTAVAGVAP
jgi:uncharacterized membrane protein YkvA (DUF1232 family)